MGAGGAVGQGLEIHDRLLPETGATFTLLTLVPPKGDERKRCDHDAGRRIRVELAPGRAAVIASAVVFGWFRIKAAVCRWFSWSSGLPVEGNPIRVDSPCGRQQCPSLTIRLPGRWFAARARFRAGIQPVSSVLLPVGSPANDALTASACQWGWRIWLRKPFTIAAPTRAESSDE